MLDIDYKTYLSNLLDNEETNEKQLTFDLYLTLLALNNKQYQEIKQEIEINTLEDFLRKVNNLKVKIQLKRKNEEIDKLLTDIKNIYEQNKNLIDKYNQENLDIISILESKNPIDITNIIDKLTKLKLTKLSKRQKYNKLRNEIVNNIFNTEYYLDEDTFYMGDTIISLTEFYEIFDYLLDIGNYQAIYHNELANTSRNNLILNIIDKIRNNTKLTNYLPVILTSLLTKNVNSEGVNTSKFNIDNIKISELYSFANYNNIDTSENAKWKKVVIPNDYLYQKIKTMITSGMYYFNNNIFTMDLINDFKTSILIDDLINFIRENINNLNKEETKHI